MNGIILAATIDSISTRKDKSVKIAIVTQELSPGKAGEVFTLLNTLAVVYISQKELDQKEIDQVDKLDPEFGGKTQSQRLRNVLFKLFDQDHEGFKDFDSFYKGKTDVIIDHLKSKIQ